MFQGLVFYSRSLRLGCLRYAISFLLPCFKRVSAPGSSFGSVGIFAIFWVIDLTICVGLHRACVNGQ